MKKRNTAFCLMAIVMTLVILVSAAVGIGAAEEEPILDIAYCNLSFRDRVCIKYAVSAENTDSIDKIKLLIWNSPSDSYTLGTQSTVIESAEKETIGGKEHAVFDYTELSAKQLTDDVYARAYIESDGEVYYSDVNKYSILRYAYNKMGKTGTASSDENLIAMLDSMLSYGGAAQTYFNYRTDRLATDDFYEIKTVGGLLSDGCDYGMYTEGESVTLRAPLKNSEGKDFSYWEDRLGFSVSESAECILTVGDRNEVYTAVYEPIRYSEGLAFTPNGDGTCSVTGRGDCGDEYIVIPRKSPVGDKVTRIGDGAFYECSDIKGVTLPSTLTDIGEFAFKGCTGIADLVMPGGVRYVGDYAFFGCMGLESVTLSDRLDVIGEHTFSGCERLEHVDIPMGVEKIGMNAFSGCVGLRSVALPDSLTEIDPWAFVNCSSLVSVTVPKNVTSIGTEAFDNCYRLVEVINLSSLEITKGSEENGCVALLAYDVHNGNSKVTEVGEYVFFTLEDTVYLMNYTGNAIVPTLPDSYCGGGYVIGEYAFYSYDKITDIIIPSGVTGIKAWAFAYCTSLKSVTVPDSVEFVETYAFFACGSVKEISVDEENSAYKSEGNCLIEKESGTLIAGSTESVIPKDGSVKLIADAAFFGCAELKSIDIPQSVIKIGSYAFYGCSGLSDIYLPDSVTTIGTYAFIGCTGIQSITLGRGVNKIGRGAFDGCSSLGAVHISDIAAFCGISFADCGANPLYYAGTLYLGGSPVTELVIPEGVLSVGAYGFAGCTSIESVIMNSKFTTLGKYAFYKCDKLSSIDLSEELTVIGDYAFYGCAVIKSVTLPKTVTKIGAYAFGNCPMLESVKFENTEGWCVFVSADGNGDAVDVSDETKNSQNLRLTYRARYWKRVEREPEVS